MFTQEIKHKTKTPLSPPQKESKTKGHSQTRTPSCQQPCDFPQFHWEMKVRKKKSIKAKFCGKKIAEERAVDGPRFNLTCN